VVFGEVAFADIRVAPPPPAPTPVETEVVDIPLAGFELAPSDSPVKIAASPPPPDLLRVEDLSRTPPPAGMELRLPSNLKPRINVRPDTQHVYQRFEVDRVASVLVETAPQVPRRLFEDENILHTTLVWVVETDGTASHVRVLQSCGKPAVDALLIEMIQDSVFSPAMKGGRKVRMMTSQLITVKWSEGSSFHLN